MGQTGIAALLETVASLRDPKHGCPWDIEQDHQSITDCLVDECCELLQTIDRGDMEHMEEELGDVLLQVVMHAQMAKEAGHFDFDSVCHEVNAKLVRRHPHVFGEGKVKDSAALMEQWEAIKAAEKKRGPETIGRFKDLPPQLPSLMFAQDVYKQIVKQKMETGDLLDLEGIAQTKAELEAETLGARLFEIAAACQERKLDSETLLRRYAQHVVDTLEKK
ncbi:MAG: Nucleoside triphosphate pyrophosphohydrolase [Opitutia bacterium UBA7350]|nr:MAG: Nucleoside triphosphate pyrophosphohydrolase [Opitutae bacterium UBA7350]